jgi:hypothetical protein
VRSVPRFIANLVNFDVLCEQPQIAGFEEYPLASASHRNSTFGDTVATQNREDIR